MNDNGYVSPQPTPTRRRRTQHVSAQAYEPVSAPVAAPAQPVGQPVPPAAQPVPVVAPPPKPVHSASSMPNWQPMQPRQAAPVAAAPMMRPQQGMPQQPPQGMPQQPPQGMPQRPQKVPPMPPQPMQQPVQHQSYRPPQPAPQGYRQQYVPPQPVRQPVPVDYQQRGYHTPVQEQPVHGGGSQPPRKKGGRGIIIALVAVLLVAVLSVGSIYFYQYNETKNYVTPYNSVFCQGVYVDGIHLGGMTADEGVAAVTAKAQQRNDAWSVNLTFQGQVVTTLTAGQLGMKVDVIDVLREAWEQGHVGDLNQRRTAMEQLLETPWQAYTATPGGDTSVVDSVLQQIKNLVYRAPQDARLVEFNPANSYPFQFIDEVYGRVLNTEPLKETIYQMVSMMESGDVEIVPDEIAPNVTVASLKENLTMRASVYTPISTSSTTERTNNIRRSFEKISGYILEPGKKMSFNSVVGKRTLDNGFFEAIEYAYGDEVIGVGGGVCQASTTLYQAAVVGGLEIVTREPHSDSVSYAAYGEDATVYWEGGRKIDLVIKNNTDKPLYFVAAVQSDPSNRKRFVARVTIYGKSMGENVRYELTSKTIETLKPPETPEYVKDKKGTYVTYTDQEHRVRKAKDGYVVESYRVKYVNEEVVERTLLYTDRYEPKQERIYVGVKKRESK